VHCFSVVEGCQQVSFSASLGPRFQLVEESPESGVGHAEKPRTLTGFGLGKRRPGELQGFCVATSTGCRFGEPHPG